MKGEPHVLGVDDGPFQWEDCKVPVVGVVMRGATYVEGILSWQVEVDGTDATERLLAAVEASRHRHYLQAVMLDGIAQGGFNVLNPERIHDVLGVPVLTLTRGKPDRLAMKAALMAHVPDWELRWALIERNWPVSMTTADGVLSYKSWGLDDRQVGELLLRTTVRGLIPEPVRVAHMMASAFVKGESKGRA